MDVKLELVEDTSLTSVHLIYDVKAKEKHWSSLRYCIKNFIDMTKGRRRTVDNCGCELSTNESLF